MKCLGAILQITGSRLVVAIQIRGLFVNIWGYFENIWIAINNRDPN
jgi:hypothetical protein